MPDKIINKMIETAKQAQDNAYCPYSNHPVGASILAENGNIYAGSNVETAHYKGICAEASAISAMICQGNKQIDTIVIISPNENLCTPCGDCLQRIREFKTNDTKIIVVNNKGEDKQEFSLSELLPHSFGPENLKKKI